MQTSETLENSAPPRGLVTVMHYDLVSTESVLRYCSNAAALFGSVNSVNAISVHGLKGAVCCHPPLLWTASRRATLSASPV